MGLLILLEVFFYVKIAFSMLSNFSSLMARLEVLYFEFYGGNVLLVTLLAVLEILCVGFIYVILLQWKFGFV